MTKRHKLMKKYWLRHQRKKHKLEISLYQKLHNLAHALWSSPQLVQLRQAEEWIFGERKAEKDVPCENLEKYREEYKFGELDTFNMVENNCPEFALIVRIQELKEQIEAEQKTFLRE